MANSSPLLVAPLRHIKTKSLEERRGKGSLLVHSSFDSCLSGSVKSYRVVTGVVILRGVSVGFIWRIEHELVGGGCSRPATRAPTQIAQAPPLSSPKVEEVRAEIVAKKGTKVSNKGPIERATHLRKMVKVSSNRHKSRHGEEGSKSRASKGKEWVGATDES
ncbi:hypothetical protein GW17_00005511 [Ensete ventricosum]|nr:hypothetical protein GW17_00005511 [Ensete ventricosum]